MDNHGFCRVLLLTAREEAQDKGIALPSHMVALKSATGQWFVQGRSFNGRHDAGEYVSADCAYHARAMRISALIGRSSDKKS